ncbi:MAG: hydroxysqualene dehydroxylase HpnE [Sphingomonadaceae bacterium]|uniref:hydroxysqualene dehydroxylase HpnE n=1 Tax=Thermaurantiacus sp. TaxID=2820283 RepID=UPI00298F0589|nr:hydroxysqualene dehydroxylase HpnE [Thermaurantiacus sp.]MCS6986049.1 hydroxysqualene dehydroxylase HpnE [Sphingomonadaceae bacterium]MDW8414735.1 hydroxysqualene dehydroxylase HpnE [Thermaurantiacus sp.]
MTGTVHVVGAGLAGLSAALRLAAAGRRVVVHEAALQAGGRCRSFHDSRLGCRIDNGNHLVLSGNRSTLAYRALAGAAPDTLVSLPEAAFPFVDLRCGTRWTVRINDGPVPFWALVPSRRPAGVGLGAMLAAARILRAKPGQTVADAVGARGTARERFWAPMSYAVMNLPPELASARLLRATFLEAWRDGRRCRPMLAPQGLSAALVDPALAALTRLGAEVRFNSSVRGLERAEGRISALLVAGGGRLPLGPRDAVVLAVPPARLKELYPEAGVPQDSSSILNAHFRVPDPAALRDRPPLLGVVGARTQWIFVKGEVVSLTISAAQHVEGLDADEERLAPALWAEAVAALGLPRSARYAAARLVHERRATFRQTPAAVARRPKTLTALSNLLLAGDATDTGLPATIEGAIRSGEIAARHLLAGAGSGSAR